MRTAVLLACSAGTPGDTWLISVRNLLEFEELRDLVQAPDFICEEIDHEEGLTCLLENSDLAAD